jgi:hypothetical protein
VHIAAAYSAETVELALHRAVTRRFESGGDGSSGGQAGSPDKGLLCIVCSSRTAAAVVMALVAVGVSELAAMGMALPVTAEGVGFVEGRSRGRAQDDDTNDEQLRGGEYHVDRSTVIRLAALFLMPNSAFQESDTLLGTSALQFDHSFH